MICDKESKHLQAIQQNSPKFVSIAW